MRKSKQSIQELKYSISDISYSSVLINYISVCNVVNMILHFYAYVIRTKVIQILTHKNIILTTQRQCAANELANSCRAKFSGCLKDASIVSIITLLTGFIAFALLQFHNNIFIQTLTHYIFKVKSSCNKSSVKLHIKIFHVKKNACI